MSVEFLPGAAPDDGPDEQLSGGPERPRPRAAWWVAVLVAGVAIWGLTRAAPAPRHLAAPPPAASTAADPACRGRAGCSVRAGVPATIVRLAREYLPLGVHLRVRTAVAPSPRTRQELFVARDIYAHADSVTVLIRVQRGGPRTQAIAPDPLGFGSLLLHRSVAGFVVRLQYVAPDTVVPMVARLRALLRDPRLISS